MTIAWLLRINRLYGHDPRLATATRFQHAFESGHGHANTSQAQISRWEHATTRATLGVIDRYETVLGLPPGTISAVAHTLHRESLGRLGPPVLRTGQDPAGETHRDALHDLLDRAIGGDLMSGADWTRLTAGLWSIPIMLHPRSLWDHLAQRLLAELLIAEGTAWLHRCEALNQLLGHPDATQPVIDACATIIDDPRSQVLIEPMALLELSPHPAATRHLLRHIETPRGAHLARAAWWAVAEKAGRGHFDTHQTAIVTTRAADVLNDSRSHPICRLAATEALRQLLPTAPSRLRHAFDHHLRDADSDTSAPAAIGAETARGLAATTLDAMPRDVLRSDPILERKVTDMLCHPHGSRRVFAAQAIAATPYRHVLAATLARELTRTATATPNTTAAVIMIQAMTHLGTAAEAPLLRRLALGTGLPGPIGEAAAWTLGHVRGQHDDTLWPAISDWLQRAGQLPAYANAFVYSMGIAGRDSELARLTRTPSTDPALRTAASWWLDQDALVRHSARH